MHTRTSKIVTAIQKLVQLLSSASYSLTARLYSRSRKRITTSHLNRRRSNSVMTPMARLSAGFLVVATSRTCGLINYVARIEATFTPIRSSFLTLLTKFTSFILTRFLRALTVSPSFPQMIPQSRCGTLSDHQCQAAETKRPKKQATVIIS